MKRKATYVIISVLSLLWGLTITSCTDDYTECSSGFGKSSISVEEIPYIVSSRATDNEKIKFIFRENDAIGIYAVNDGKIVSGNVKFTYNKGKWVGEKDIPSNPRMKYYAYFPYVDFPYEPDFSKTEINLVFGEYVSDPKNMFHYSDQSSEAGFRASNLMIAVGSLNGDNITFRMEHKKVLVVIGYKTDCQYASVVSQEEVHSLTPYSGNNKPYISVEKGYFYAKPNVTTNIWGMDVNENAGVRLRESETHISGTPTLSYQVSTNGSTWRNAVSCPSWLNIKETTKNGKTLYLLSTTDEKTTDVLIDKVPSSNSKKLQQATPITSYRDLSMYKNNGMPRGSRTTANCYLVHAPGKYKLPLIYGNAIRNGTKNTLAYKATIKDKNVRPTLLNHLGNEITDPWIKNNGINVSNGSVVWQEVQNLITNVRIEGDYLTFEVDKDKITESNAVVAAQTSDGSIAWSWHIWITPETLSDITPINTGQHIYKVAPVDLGWVAPKYMCNVYAGSKCRVIATYPDGNSCYFEVTQPDCTVETDEVIGFGGYTYYQFGRKDPMPRSNDEAESLQTLYHYHGMVSFSVGTGKNTIPELIRNPMLVASDFVDEDLKYNYWDINQNGFGDVSTPTIKTIYDPCPPDMVVPTGNLYVYMGGESMTSKGESNTDLAISIWNENGKKVSFPGRGLADIENNLAFFMELYLAHSATLIDPYTSNAISAISGSWESIYETFSKRQMPLAVRPVVEE